MLDKYLKSRKGLNIFDNLQHITNIVNVLAKTIEIMQKIDSVIKL